MVLEGADIALERTPDAALPAVRRREPRSRPLLAKLPRLAAAATLHHTDEMVPDDAKPSLALRTGRQSSMRLAIDAVADGRADGVVSAGNTGALMAMAKFVLKTLPGIDRPAIAIVFPDPARRERDARPRRQYRMRRREPRAVRADGRRLRAHRARPRRADGRPAQCRLGGSEGQRRGARRQRAAARRR